MGAILGLNAYHGDAAACLLIDGRVVAAAEEERFRRVKHWAGFPAEAIRYCLRAGGLGLGDVDHVAANSDPAAARVRRAAFVLTHPPRPAYVLDRLRHRRRRASLRSDLERHFPGARLRASVTGVEHHLAHLASAYYLSPFDEAAVVSVDGFGDFSSAAWGRGTGNRLQVDRRVFFPHSLGIFYEALTQYLGFPHYGDEYKVMGLAAYGRPAWARALEQIVRLESDGGFRLDLRFFQHHTKPGTFTWEGGAPTSAAALYTSALEELLGPARRPEEPIGERHRDIACSVQAVYEHAFFSLLGAAHRAAPVEAVALAGGCAFNSVANGKVTERTPFRRVWVQPAAGDAGGALGAALHVHHRSLDAGAPHAHLRDPYLGPAFTEPEIASLLASRAGEIAAVAGAPERLSDDVLVKRVAQAIADGLVVGWFQGRMEWGPRALGNRSILADPRRGDMKDLLNLKVKRRESFRPFAPSILREHVAEWFETEDDVPFMTRVFAIRPEKRPLVPAVTHVDGTGRLQTVHRDTNPRYWELIRAFGELTGVPMVLNTSFNENEPVVCRPEEALACFLRTRMDLLVLGEWMVERAARSGS
jgi:carbamoyltransferase